MCGGSAKLQGSVVRDHGVGASWPMTRNGSGGNRRYSHRSAPLRRDFAAIDGPWVALAPVPLRRGVFLREQNRYNGGWVANRGTILVLLGRFGRVGTFAKTKRCHARTKNIEDKHLKPLVKNLKTTDNNLRGFGNLRTIVSPRFFRKFKTAVVTKRVGPVSESSADAS